MTTHTPAPKVAYYLGRPAALWLAALSRRPTRGQVSSGCIWMAPQGHSVAQMPQPLQ
jgi:hypothetical protein